ncbi:CHAT domain-containing protein [Streptomyces sudanensis]|uniref:CHAT domain-containing protein n=1 Tax=Streptomyces sudanensis TaxID=436397 RepID=UPI0020CFB0F3|nr:CHAT domain-containing protein [Streptomyces sudanensis]MCP9985384.1 CHAT domain-containing protein [Streptomyces sudanensis]
MREAIRSIPDDHPNRAPVLSNLASAMFLRHQQTGAGADRDAAALAWEEGAKTETAAPSIRIRSAWAAAVLLADVDAGRASDAAETAVMLLPQVTPLRLERGEQQYVLSDFAGLAADAAALALSSSEGTESTRAERALRLLEAGRSILLSQALDARTDLTDLYQRHPELARRFIDLRDQLNNLPGSPEDWFVAVGGGSDRNASQSSLEPVDRHRLVEELDHTLAEIRGLSGFASFALPPTSAELLKEASQGPVVVFNVSNYRSDALLLTPNGISHLALPRLAAETVWEKVDIFRQALHTAASGPNKAQRRQAQDLLVTVLEWLWDAATGPVLEALGIRSQPTAAASDEDWPRVWWTPGGLLGLLPVHAAGYHADPADDPHRRTVMDRVISSYTPTVRALRHARENISCSRGQPSAADRALIVAMPTTPGLPEHGRLEFAAAEAAMLQAHLPNSVLLQEPSASSHLSPSDASKPTKRNVLAHLHDCSIVHFACHGNTDPVDPSKSLLLLHDHANDPLTVGSLAPIALQQAQLAYLSACRTAVIDKVELLDEAIHLTSAFQIAGFPHVIGTLWEIYDQIAVTTAEAFYTALKDPGGAVDPNRAAMALHRAVRSVRDGHDLPVQGDRRRTPLLWAAYLHAGA